MSMATSYQELRRLSKAELIALHDELAPRTDLGLGFYREEIARREHEEQTAEMLTVTRVVARLTWVITGLTVLNVIAVLFTLTR